MISGQELAVTARSLDDLRDTFSVVGPLLATKLAATCSAQTCLDNMDIDSEHLTIEYIMYETREATSHLDTTPMNVTEVLKLFKLETLQLSSEEKRHLAHDVIPVGVSKVLARLRPDCARLAKLLPKRHHHANSGKPLAAAQVTIETPYPYQETRNSDTVLLCLRRQRKYLRRVASWRKDDQDFARDLTLLEDAEAEISVREAAEQRVMSVCQSYGEDISHGDLLTVAMQENAKVIMAGSVTAFGRLEYLGGMRLGLMHFKMKKVCVDFGKMMPSLTNYEDEGSLAWLASITNRNDISNRPKDIKKNDSSFEKHDQFYAAVAEQAIANMFDNLMVAEPERLNRVVDEASAVEFVVAMLNRDGVLERLCFDPDRQEGDGQEDDLYCYYRELVIRFLPSLALDLCEEEGDAEGLLAIEKLMIYYFLASNLPRQDCKYADYTLYDVILYLGSSERTKARMRENVVINPSGTAGGGMAPDKYNEIIVRMAKACLRRQHGGLDDILMEKDIAGLTVLNAINHNYRMALLRGKLGKEHSQDYVKEEARTILGEQIARLDPFSRSRTESVKFMMSVRADPYTGLTVQEVTRFLERKGKQWKTKQGRT